MSQSGIDLSCILRSLQATDDTTWSRHIVLKAVASVEEGRPITRTHVIHLSDDAEDVRMICRKVLGCTGAQVNESISLFLCRG